MEIRDITMIVVGVIIPIVGWFIKRDIHRFEKTAEKQSELLEKHNDSLVAIQTQIAQVVSIGKWEPNLQRFFGDGGGNARIWRAIEALQFDMEQSRERHHWIANKMAVLKGSMEVAGMKCGDPAGWQMPEWKHMKERETK